MNNSTNYSSQTSSMKWVSKIMKMHEKEYYFLS